MHINAKRVGVGVALVLAGSAGVAMAQEVSIPPVTTANAGGYAQPLKLDTDRYDFEQRQKARQGRQRTGGGEASPVRSRTGSQGSQPTQREIEAVMARLAPEYRARVRRDGEQSALVWLRQAAFEAGQEAAARR